MTLVKQAIPWGLLLLVPALMATGATGFAMARKTDDALIQAKRRRMPIIGGIGLFILTPCALYLSRLAALGTFGATFYLVQLVELAAGAVNIALMTRNFRDGLRFRTRVG